MVSHALASFSTLQPPTKVTFPNIRGEREVKQRWQVDQLAGQSLLFARSRFQGRCCVQHTDSVVFDILTLIASFSAQHSHTNKPGRRKAQLFQNLVKDNACGERGLSQTAAAAAAIMNFPGNLDEYQCFRCMTTARLPESVHFISILIFRFPSSSSIPIHLIEPSPKCQGRHDKHECVTRPLVLR